MALLEIEDLKVVYGRVEALHGISLSVEQGEVVTLIGSNGAGKTTTVRTISGLVPVSGGRIKLDGNDITGLSAPQIVKRGIGHAPEGRHVFPRLTVRDNLAMGSYLRRDRKEIRADIERVFKLFPRLLERESQLAGTLSGGEQQMLAIGRILRTGARLLLLDEPTEGLAPVIIQQIGRTIRALKQEGFTILLVEQNFRFASTVADRYFIMEHGRIVEGFVNSELDANVEKLHDYLGV